MEKIIIILVGLVWGSFLNVVIYRLPRKQSLVYPPSTCPSCGQRIKPYDNIPLVSFLLLRGKCRSCGASISWRYPLVEAITAASLLLLYFYFGLSLHFFAGALYTSALICLGFIDYDHQLLPDMITLPGFGLGLVYTFFRRDLNFGQGLLGAATGAGVLLIVYGLYYLLRKKEGLGLGDVTMMLFVGSFVGWRGALLTLVLASFVGALIGLFFIKMKQKDLQSALPFGTFLAPAAFIAFFWGEIIINSYLQMFPR
ncbi:MAG: prepilin peptidase [Candidatus Aminicenantes bacterium 4484_214]|nr:MAG: prepilin peptidase [Candidatus Aminicenantes bacterium 4484_214]HDJ22536.1 prepilin peptidase [Candidatus Aminicenantes bacterium]